MQAVRAKALPTSVWLLVLSNTATSMKNHARLAIPAKKAKTVKKSAVPAEVQRARLNLDPTLEYAQLANRCRTATIKSNPAAIQISAHSVIPACHQ